MLYLMCHQKPVKRGWLLSHTLVKLRRGKLVLAPGVSGNSRSRSFPRMEASDSLSRTLGMDFFIPFPFPNFGNGFFSFPSRSRILGMGFFHSLPIPEIWEWIFLFPSRSQISGMGFFNSLPVPKFREWDFSIPFPFPNSQKSFPLTPDPRP